jgi:phosphoglycerol transferase MdoB-like AlkP superfamily enzyme
MNANGNKLAQRNKMIYILLFFGLNILNGFLVTTPIYNRSLSPYNRNLFMIMNYFLGDMGFMTIVFAISIFLFRKDINRFRFLMAFSIINSIICIGMMMFSYNYYGMLFSFGNLKALNNPAGSKAFGFLVSVVGQLLTHAQYLSIIPAIIMVVFFILLRKKNRPQLENVSIIGNGKSRAYFGVSLSIIGALLMINSLSSYRIQIEETWYEDNRDVLYGVQTVGLYNYYVYDFYSYYFTDIYEVNEEKIEEINEFLQDMRNSNRVSPIDGLEYGNNLDLNGVFKNKNLILIQAESLSNFVIGLKVNGKEITPNLNKMVNEGVYFNNFYTTVGIGNTSDAEFTAMTGFYPNGEDLSIYTFGKGEYETLPKDFKESNYYTFSMHGNTNIFYSRGKIHPSLYGFDKHFGLEELDKSSPLVHGWISDEALLKQTIDQIIATPEYDFAFPVLVSCHTPYLYDPQINEVLTSQEFSLALDISDEFLRGYLEHSYYVDYCIGKGLDYLEEKGIADETIIALYGDHGGGVPHERFIENKSVLENKLNPFDEPLFTFPSKVSQYAFRKISQEIPFIIYEPSSKKLIEPKIISLVRGETDIYRTISNLFGLNSKYYFGVDALNNEPSFIYNPRNLDVFVDEFLLFLPPLEIYNYPYNLSSNNEIERIAQLVKYYKDLNDKVLKFKNYKKN